MKSYDEIEAALGESIGFVISIVFRRMRKRTSRALQKAGLDYGSWYFLRILWIEEGCTQRQLCDLTELSQPTAAATLDRMRKKGLIVIEPSPEDRRAGRIFLTEQARELQKQFGTFSSELHAQNTRGMTEEEVRELYRLLRKLGENCLG